VHYAVPAAQTVPHAVLVVSLATSWPKLCNLHDQSHKYVASHFSSSVWFSTDILLSISVSMSPGIASVHLPFSSVGTMVSKREESKTPFSACLEM